jgi:parvulin-like peptidyl-prolyl isomerase
VGLAGVLGAGEALAEPPAPPAASTPATPEFAATVNGETIPLAKVDAYIRAKLAVVPLTNSQLHDLRAEVAADMADELLLKQFLAKNAPKVEPAEIDKQLAAFSESLTRRGKTLAGFLKETDQTEAALREAWTTELQLNGYAKQTVTDDRLRQYYATNKDHFDKVEVKASHIVIHTGRTATPVEKARAKEKLQAIRAQLVAGRLGFAAAAKRYSQCPSAPDGGDLGFIPRKGGLMDEPFCRAAFALKVGEVSGVVETEYGAHLITVTERKPGTPSEFERCVEDVRDALTQDLRAELIARLRKETPPRVTVP